MLNCCLFKKCSSRRPSRESVRFPGHVVTRLQEAADIQQQCGRCGTDQQVPSGALAMVCSRCQCVNRLRSDKSSGQRRNSFIDCDVGDCQLIQNTEGVFQLGDNPDGKSIPVCSVCLDGPGDMILENCGHGGICEDCARHIALNKAVGGAHCPLDKLEIVHLLRIGELNDQFLKAREVELPLLPQNEPPRVPPPVGLRKDKGPTDIDAGVDRH